MSVAFDQNTVGLIGLATQVGGAIDVNPLQAIGVGNFPGYGERILGLLGLEVEGRHLGR